MQFAHDGVSHHADVAFHGVRVLASGSAPWRRAARAVLRRGDRLQRWAAAPLPFLDASRLRCGSACPRTDPSARTSTALGVPANVCTRMSSRLQKLSTVPLHELDAVMCTDPGGQHPGCTEAYQLKEHPRLARPGGPSTTPVGPRTARSAAGPGTRP